MTLSTRLKEATWASHQSAESRAWQKSLARGEAEPARLALYLTQLQRIHAALERLVDADPIVRAGLAWNDEYRHSRRLAADLEDLAVADSANARLPLLPVTSAILDAIARAVATEPFALLGFLYVLEGSMNGNRFLVRALRRGSVAAHCKLRYFDPYGEQQPTRWAAFKLAFDRVTLGPEEESAVLAAALATFEGVSEISERVMESGELLVGSA